MDLTALEARVHRGDRAVAWATPFLAFAIAVLATVYRQRGVPRVQTVWAEDGPTFTACAYAQSLPSCVAEPYRGWRPRGARVGPISPITADAWAIEIPCARVVTSP